MINEKKFPSNKQKRKYTRMYCWIEANLCDETCRSCDNSGYDSDDDDDNDHDENIHLCIHSIHVCAMWGTRIFCVSVSVNQLMMKKIDFMPFKLLYGLNWENSSRKYISARRNNNELASSVWPTGNWRNTQQVVEKKKKLMMTRKKNWSSRSIGIILVKWLLI